MGRRNLRRAESRKSGKGIRSIDFIALEIIRPTQAKPRHDAQAQNFGGLRAQGE